MAHLAVAEVSAVVAGRRAAEVAPAPETGPAVVAPVVPPFDLAVVGYVCLMASAGLDQALPVIVAGPVAHVVAVALGFAALAVELAAAAAWQDEPS